jgi:hypothetical protein
VAVRAGAMAPERHPAAVTRPWVGLSVSSTLPWTAKLHSRSLERLPHCLVIAAKALGEALTRPALAVQPYHLVQQLSWHALPSKLYAGPAEVRGYGRTMHAPAGGERLHVLAALVLGDESCNLLRRQSTLRLSRRHRLGSMRPTTEQGRQFGR